MRETWLHWVNLWKNQSLKELLGISASFWVATAGGHGTILPLILIGPQFGLDVGQTGLVFAGLAAAQVLATPSLAFLSDCWGKEKVLLFYDVSLHLMSFLLCKN